MSRWYKRDGAAFIQGTMGLTLEEKGAYSLVLDLIYANDGPIADDARWLSGVCGVSIRKWLALRDALIQAGKISADSGQLMNARAERELKTRTEGHDNATENGSKGGRKVRETSTKHPRNVAENEVTSNENNGITQANRIEQNREEQKEEGRGAAVAASPPIPDLFEIPAFLDRREKPSAEIVPLVTQPDREIEVAVEAYNLTAEYAKWPLCQVVTDKRRKALKLRLGEAGGLAGWKDGMARAARSSFLLGKTGRSGEHSNWRPDIDFFLAQSKFTKLMEGGYDDPDRAQGAGGHLDRLAQAGAIALAGGDPAHRTG